MTNKGGWKFRKPRGSRACHVCRLRKVRCDAESQMPCTNCVTFGSECRFPEPRKKRNTTLFMNTPQVGTSIILTGNHGSPIPIAPFSNTVQLSSSYSPVLMTGDYNDGRQIPLHQMGQIQATNQEQVPMVTHIPQAQMLQTGQMPQTQSLTPQLFPTQQIPHLINVPQNQQYALSTQHQPHYPQWMLTDNAAQQNMKNSTDITMPYNDPLANISVQNIMPDYNPSTDTSTSSHGIQVTRNRKLSEYLYFGATSCYSYFMDDEGNENDPDGKQNYSSLGYRMSYKIQPGEILTELQILNIRGAFNLPSKALMIKLFDSFFNNLYSQVPIINRDAFMTHFNHPNPNMRPPLILIQAILLAGARSCHHPALLDSDNNTRLVCNTIYLRIKALFDSNIKFEYVGNDEDTDDGHLVFNYPTVMIQVCCLLSWHWDGPEDVSRGTHFWIRTAITIAQAVGFQRDMNKTFFIERLQRKHENNKFMTYKTKQQVFYWKKILWWLFCRDRSLSMSFGRPLIINMKDIATELLTLDDFEIYESKVLENEEDKIMPEYFIYLVQLSEITGLVIQEQYQVKHDNMFDINLSKRNDMVVKQLNLLMGIFFESLPVILKFNVKEPKSVNVFSSLIGSQYYVTLYHINRVRLANIQGDMKTNKYWGIAFQSAFMISQIAQYLSERIKSGDNKLLSGQLVYTISLSTILLSFHTDSTNNIVAKTASSQMNICLNFLRQCHETWPGITFMLISFFTEKLNNADRKDELISKAKKLLIKICHEYITTDEKGKQTNDNPSKNFKTFDINFLLNESEVKSNTSKEEFGISNFEESDLSLPIYNIVSIKLPPLDSNIYKNFNATQLFQKDKVNYDVSPTLTPAQTPSSTYPISNLQTSPTNVTFAGQNHPSNASGSTTTTTSIPDQQIFPSNSFPNTFIPNSTDTAPTSSTSYANENIPFYNNSNDNSEYPYIPPDQPSDIDLQDSRILDSQYFLNVNSGVNWNSYDI